MLHVRARAQRLRRLLAFGLVSLLFPSAGYALDPSKELGQYTLDIWRTRDGLPGVWVRGFAQTEDGYLWIATNGGVARYNGERLVTVPRDEAFARVGDLVVVSVDRRGTVWLAPSRGEPLCYRGDEVGACSHSEMGLPAGVRIGDIEPGAGDEVWMASAQEIYRFDGKRVHRVFRAGPGDLISVRDMLRGPDGRLWIGAEGGLFTLEAGGRPQRFSLAAGNPVGGVQHLAAGRRGDVWVAGDGFLLHLDAEGARLYDADDGVPDLLFTRILEDRDHNVWISSRQGLVRWRRDGEPGTFTVYTEENGLPDDDVMSMFEDREGSLWIGTRGAGMAQLTDRTLASQVGPEEVRDSWVSALCQSPDGTFWFGLNEQLVRWKDGVSTVYDARHGLPDLPILTLYPSPEGGVWIGSEAGLHRMREGKVERPLDITDAVSALYEDAAGQLWLGTDQGIYIHGGGKLRKLPAPAWAAGRAVRAMAHDDQGKVWISVRGQLAFIEDGKIRHGREIDAPDIGAIRSIHRDHQGTLWFGAGEALLRRRQGNFFVFMEPHGLTRDGLFQVASDPTGHLWIGTIRGVLRVPIAALDRAASGRQDPNLPTSLAVATFDTSDQRRDLDATRARQPGVWRDLQGHLWFPAQRGLVRIAPSRVRINRMPPPVVIESATLDGRVARRRRFTAFAPGSGAFEVHYAGVTLIEPHKANHRYRLDGFDRDWVEAGSRRVAYYTNLPPGNYRFRVQASNADGIWNTTGDWLSFGLAPYFYRTWWFFVALGATVLGLAFSFHRMRLKRIRSEYLATWAERSRVARELHDSLLQGMSGVAMQLRGLRKRLGRVSTDEAKTLSSDFKTVEEAVAGNLEETRRFVWNLRVEPGAHGDLARRLSALAAQVGREGGIEVKVEQEGPKLEVPEGLENELYRVAQEALANARKHAACDNVWITVRYSPGEIDLVVADDGVGFDPAHAQGAEVGRFGLLGLRERGRRLGTLTIDSKKGEGTQIRVTARTVTWENGEGDEDGKS